MSVASSKALEPRHTAPLSVLVGAAAGLQNAVVPVIAIAFGTGTTGFGVLIALGVGGAILAVAALFSYIRWKRLTYTIGIADIRVESGVLSRSARSVPYERIQDVSLEQKLIPRLFGLVAVKFETGAGGGEDLSLSFLREDDGEELRQLVRTRRDEEAQGIAAAAGKEPADAAPVEEAEPLFTMGPGRLFTFGLFEFSLAVFAVLFGLMQTAGSFIDFEFWDADFWLSWFVDEGSNLTDQISGASTGVQALGAIGALVGLFVVGSATGMFRVFAREWGFLLEQTARGFRRRRGLFTRTDVVMPIHRVQGVKLGTGFVRYRFGWHNLRFVSLAQDLGASSHVVAPFARLNEIAPIVEAAGFHLPDENADWHRATETYLFDNALSDAMFFLIASGIAFTTTSIYAPEWTTLAAGIPLVLAGISALANVLAWRYQRHALDDTQIMASKGMLSPRSQIATRMKLHSVQISQGPIARFRGYATLHLGQAGGQFSIPGIPVERARQVRREVLETIAATDFSQLERA